MSRESRVSQDQRGSSLGEREEEDERGTRTTPEERRHAKLAQAPWIKTGDGGWLRRRRAAGNQMRKLKSAEAGRLVEDYVQSLSLSSLVFSRS